MAKKYVKDRDLGWDRIKDGIKSMDGAHVDVGVLSNAPDPKKGKVNMAKLAAIHEFGWPQSGIPSRPFMRQAFDASIERLKRFARAKQSEMYMGRISPKRALDSIGVFFVGRVKEIFIKGDFEPLKPATIIKKTVGGKRGTTPLIDTGRLRNSIDHRVGGI